MTARRAHASDLHAVLALYRELRPHDPVLSPQEAASLWTRVHDSPGSMIVVCEHEGRIGATWAGTSWIQKAAQSSKPKDWPG